MPDTEMEGSECVLPRAPHQLCFPKVPSVGCPGVRRWAGRCPVVAVSSRWVVVREGSQDPFYGSAGVTYVGVLGSCMCIRCGRPIECAAVSKLFSLGLHRRRPRRPMDNSSLRVRVLEFSTRTKTAYIPFTEQAHMPSRELERRRNRHRQRWTFPPVLPLGALASNIDSTLPFCCHNPSPSPSSSHRAFISCDLPSHYVSRQSDRI